MKMSAHLVVIFSNKLQIVSSFGPYVVIESLSLEQALLYFDYLGLCTDTHFYVKDKKYRLYLNHCKNIFEKTDRLYINSSES